VLSFIIFVESFIILEESMAILEESAIILLVSFAAAAAVSVPLSEPEPLLHAANAPIANTNNSFFRIEMILFVN
jgi:hypothetical protein